METPKKLEINNNKNIMSSRLKMELVRGKEYASQLEALLHKPILGDEESALAQQLAQNVFRSFNDSLFNPSLLMSLLESSLIGPGGEAVDRASSGRDLGFQKRDVVVNKNRRGCYKRRRDIESYVNVSPNMDDGYAWRKYGQKEILNLKYPRCYFRCTHKFDQGCRAVKQVQKVDDQERSKYQTTYFGHHTCKNLKIAPQIIISDSEETKEQNTNMICFQEKANQVPFSAVEMKQESKGAAQSDDVTDDVSSNVPNNKFMWNDVVGGTGSSLPVEMEYYPKMEFFHDHQEVPSRSLGDLDIKTFNDSTHLFQ